MEAQTIKPDRPRRYLSAVHALDTYIEICAGLDGAPALDYERLAMHVQSSPADANPWLDDIGAKWELEESFERAKDKAGAKGWEYWVHVRVHNRPLRGLGAAKTSVARIVAKVDAAIEEELHGRGLLIRSEVRG